MNSKYVQSQKSKKLEEFRVNIRKKELSEYFEERRREFFIKQQDQEISNLIDQLKNRREKQTQFLTICSRQLTGEANQQWEYTVKKLMNASMAFDGQFSQWLQLSIVKNLVMAVKDTYFPMRIAPLICQLFSDMVYLSSQNQTDFASKLMEYEPLQYFVRHGTDANYQLPERLKCLQLCANLVHDDRKYRNSLYKLQASKWILGMAKEIIDNKTYFKLAQFLQCVRAVIIYHPKDTIDATKINLVLQLMTFIFHYFNDSATPQKIVLKCLDVLSQMLKHNKQIFYKNLYNSIPAFRRTMFLLVDEDLSIRYKAIYLLSLLSYFDDLNMALQFLQQGFLNQAYHVYTNLKGNQNGPYCRTLVITLSNLCCSSSRVTQAILQHPIFECVIDQLSHSQMKNKKQGFECLNTIINNIKTISFQHLIQKYNLLYYLTFGLTELRFVDAQTMIEIITTLTNLIQKSENIYNKAGNLVVNKLQNSYGITRTLQEILNKTNHELLRANANQLHRIIAEIIWSNEIV